VTSSTASRSAALLLSGWTAAGVEEHGAPAEAGEVVLDLVALDRGAPGDDRLEQVAQVGDVPLPVAELVEVAAEGLVAADPKTS
jgi:hypothetical protein